VGLRFLALIEAVNGWLIPHGEVGRFDKGPRQILISILGIAVAFAFAITEFRTAHKSAIEDPLAHRGKAVNLADFVKGFRNLY